MTATARVLLGATLELERLRNARRLLALRAALTASFFALSGIAVALGVRGAGARLPIVAAYCILSVGLYAVGRYRLEILRHSWVAIAILDVPSVYAFQRAAMREVPEHALLMAAMTVAIYLLLVMAAQLAIRRFYLVLTAATSYALLIVLFAAVPGVSRTIWLDALLLLVGAVVGTYLSARLLGLVQKVAQE